MQMNVFNQYTYTLEMIIQAGQKGWRLPCTNQNERYLMTFAVSQSIPAYIQRSILTILRIFMIYQPLRFFMMLGCVPFTLGLSWRALAGAVFKRP